MPQAAQKPRSAISELAKSRRRAAGEDEMRRAARPANAMNGPPLAFWHIRQWQMFAPVGGAVSAIAHRAALAAARQANLRLADHPIPLPPDAAD